MIIVFYPDSLHPGLGPGHALRTEPLVAAAQSLSDPVSGYGAGADTAREACGVVGVYLSGQDVARVAFFGIYALQHRGQESAGIASADGHRVYNRTSMGLIGQSFAEDDLLDLPGHISIAHTRYSTTGSNRIVNAQPVMARGPGLELALGHNGNVINALELRQDLEEQGFRFDGTSDTEIIANLLANAPAQDWEGRISYLMRKLKGAYSLTVLTKNELIGIRDPLGVRPLCLDDSAAPAALMTDGCSRPSRALSITSEPTTSETSSQARAC